MTARRWVGWGLVAAVPLAFLGLFFVLPTGTLIARGFSTAGSLDLSGFGEVFSRPRTWRIVGLTFLQATLGTVFAVGLGIPGAYVLYRRRFRGQWLARALVTVPFVLPTVVVGVAFRSLLAKGGPLGALHLDGTLAAIVAALVFFNYSVVVRTVGGFWAHLDPRAEQASRVLGAPPWRAFLSVTLPALVPAITAAASIVFLFCATAFGVVLILGGIRFGTIETEIWIQTTQFLNLRAASVLSVVQLVVVGAVLGVSGAARRRRVRALRLAAAEPFPRGLGSRRRDRARRRRPDRVADAVAGAAIVADLSRLEPAELRQPRDHRRPRGADRDGVGRPRQLGPDGRPRDGDRRRRRSAGSPGRLAAPALPVRAACHRDARRGVHAAARGVRGDGRLRIPDRPAPAA